MILQAKKCGFQAFATTKFVNAQVHFRAGRDSSRSPLLKCNGCVWCVWMKTLHEQNPHWVIAWSCTNDRDPAFAISAARDSVPRVAGVTPAAYRKTSTTSVFWNLLDFTGLFLLALRSLTRCGFMCCIYSFLCFLYFWSWCQVACCHRCFAFVLPKVIHRCRGHNEQLFLLCTHFKHFLFFCSCQTHLLGADFSKCTQRPPSVQPLWIRLYIWYFPATEWAWVPIPLCTISCSTLTGDSFWTQRWNFQLLKELQSIVAGCHSFIQAANYCTVLHCCHVWYFTITNETFLWEMFTMKLLGLPGSLDLWNDTFSQNQFEWIKYSDRIPRTPAPRPNNNNNNNNNNKIKLVLWCFSHQSCHAGIRLSLPFTKNPGRS